jgi:hypothetical protein
MLRSAEHFPCPAPCRQANPYFAAGRVTVPALLDTFACQSFFNEVGEATLLLMPLWLLLQCVLLSPAAVHVTSTLPVPSELPAIQQLTSTSYLTDHI